MSPLSGSINTTGEAELRRMGSTESLFSGTVKRAPIVKYTFKNQIVEAIRISHELAGRVNDQAGLWRMYVLIIWT